MAKSTVAVIASQKGGGFIVRTNDVDANPVELGEGVCVELVIQNRKTNNDGTVNANVILFGTTDNQVYELQPGEHSPRIPVNNLNLIYIRQQ